ncbi:uncharacterized protein LOC121728213 [Aricia agestis]|uniref:uncharacterized protein LOC121728213 n=1 Tax=Aricia agestis TaxID=91739 RepID=UPI001C20502E|nr:uncharacterized protein LOC121728213 [Aricia agestis]
MYLECGGSGSPTPRGNEASRKRIAQSQSSQSQAGGDAPLAKRSLIPSSSTSSRPLREDGISYQVNYGSEEETDDDVDEDEIGPLNNREISRVARAYMGLDDDEVSEIDTTVCLSWPPPPLSSPSPLPSTSNPSLPDLEKFNFNWSAFPQLQVAPDLRREPFSDINCGPTVPIASPYDAFTAIWDRSIMEYIADETNAYAQQNVALDESLTMWKGWLDINQFIRNKAAAVGIKTYENVDTTGVVYHRLGN